MRHETQKELWPGKIQPKHQLFIARDEAGHAVAFLAVSCRAVVQHAPARLIHAPKAGPAQAKGKVCILEVGAEEGIQKAGFKKRRTTIKTRRSRGTKDFLGFFVVRAERLIKSAIVSPAAYMVI